jgi:glycosyltransferase involved in cell wall biosynthesis
MIHLFFDASAASAGSGLTYVRNIVPSLEARNDVRATILVNPEFRQQLQDRKNIAFLTFPLSRGGTAGRFWRVQSTIPSLIRETAAEVLVSAGNFALFHPPAPQILLSGNALYTSRDFVRDLCARHDWALWVDTRIKAWFARKSVQLADCTIAPSESFAQELRKWTGVQVTAVHHGFDREVFFGDTTPLSDDLQGLLGDRDGELRLLFVSHYNYYRNFETLFRAVPLLQRRLGHRKVKLVLTCKLSSAENPGRYHAEPAAALVRELAISSSVAQLGAIPYRLLHHVHRACDIYVTPAYVESFAHPLVEAMASGLPVVASDLSVHQEVCRDAALYFPRFSPEQLADSVFRIAEDPKLGEQLSRSGLQRSHDFSWRSHVASLVEIAGQLVQSNRQSHLSKSQGRR